MGHARLHSTQKYTRILPSELKRVHAKAHPGERRSRDLPAADPTGFFGRGAVRICIDTFIMICHRLTSPRVIIVLGISINAGFLISALVKGGEVLELGGLTALGLLPYILLGWFASDPRSEWGLKSTILVFDNGRSCFVYHHNHFAKALTICSSCYSCPCGSLS